MNIDIDSLVKYSQIISPVFAFLAIIVSWIIYLKQKRRERKEKAIQAGLEIESIVILIAYINMVLELESSEIVRILRCADRKSMRKFEGSEIYKVYPQSHLKELKKYFTYNIYNQQAAGAPLLTFKASSRNLQLARNRHYNLFDKDISNIPSESLDDVLAHEFHRKIVGTLNKLETLCMMIVKKVADEDAVYNSMADIFLDFISKFYYFIATTNANLVGPDKKLKNVIKMFNRWERRSEREKSIANFFSVCKESLTNKLNQIFK